MRICWSPITDFSPLDEQRIDIWLINLNSRFPETDQLKALLSHTERARAERFMFDEHRLAYIVSQAYLRTLIARYENSQPQMINFSFGKYGKPFLAGSSLQFNLSHSHGYALYAFTLDKEIGIDIEYQRERVHRDGLVDTQFSPREQQHYWTLPESQRSKSFYKGWSCKEAFIKAIGVGLSFPLQNFSVDMDPRQAGRLIEIEGDETAASSWHLQCIHCLENYSAAWRYKCSIQMSATFYWIEASHENLMLLPGCRSALA